MLLVEELLGGDATSVSTAITIDETSAFYDEKLRGVPAWVGLEYMAQTAAVWVGMDDIRNQRPVQLGFLVSARQYRAHQPLFALGQRLVIDVTRQFGDDAVVVFNGIIRTSSGEPVADAHFTAYRPDDVNSYLRGEVG